MACSSIYQCTILENGHVTKNEFRLSLHIKFFVPLIIDHCKNDLYHKNDSKYYSRSWIGRPYTSIIGALICSSTPNTFGISILVKVCSWHWLSQKPPCVCSSQVHVPLPKCKQRNIERCTMLVIVAGTQPYIRCLYALALCAPTPKARGKFDQMK